jgi:hypothetical protein
VKGCCSTVCTCREPAEQRRCWRSIGVHAHTTVTTDAELQDVFAKNLFRVISVIRRCLALFEEEPGWSHRQCLQHPCFACIAGRHKQSNRVYEGVLRLTRRIPH